MIKILHADTLGEYYSVISDIEKDIRQNEDDDGKAQLLWFRGEAQIKFSLIPSNFRNNNMMMKTDDWCNYSNLHYAEEIRMHHFNAKNYQFLSQKPTSKIEWLELMQHHGMQARVLDWSESSTHSLLFALQPFCSNTQGKNICEWTPCVWVLNPQGLNKDIFLAIGKDSNLQMELMKELELDTRERSKVMYRLSQFLSEKNLDRYMGEENASHIGYIMNMSAIDEELLKNGEIIKGLVSNYTVWNPIWFFLSKVYSQGHILSERKLPPLAIVQPYHSERIRSQHGVFTVFPYYEEISKEKRDYLKMLNVNPDAMSFNEIAKKHLYKIVLRQPQTIARELIMNGIFESWLYPEMPIIAGEIERRGAT